MNSDGDAEGIRDDAVAQKTRQRERPVSMYICQADHSPTSRVSLPGMPQSRQLELLSLPALASPWPSKLEGRLISKAMFQRALDQPPQLWSMRIITFSASKEANKNFKGRTYIFDFHIPS